MKKPVKLLIALVALGVAGYFLVGYLRHHWPAIAAHEWHLSPGWLALSWAVLTASMALTAEGWRRSLAALGGPLPMRRSWFVWALGQTGKYIPGMVWPMAAKVALTRKHGIPAGIVALSGVAELMLVIGSALCFALLALPLVGGEALATTMRDAGWPPGVVWASWAVALGGLLILHPKVFTPITGVLLRLARVDTRPAGLTPTAMARLLGWYLLSWSAHGLAMALFCQAAVSTLGPGDWPVLAAAYVTSFIMGFLVVFLPMGLGVQEAIFVLLAGAVFPEPALAIVMCLATRLWLALGEMSLLGVSLVGRRKAE
ncbi:MAG: lysylphosphatidylglycerol synthase transmembrane domain-containing protein [Bradymonadia bacterium]